MKSLKVYYMGQRLRDIYPHATRFQVLKWKVREALKKFLRLMTALTVVSAVLLLTFTAGQWSTPEHVIAQTITKQDTTQYPVLDRIAKCESKTGQFTASGQVVINQNQNGTVDVGAYQINLSPEHIREATKLGYNLMTYEGNKTYAMYIYTHYGTGAWSSSANCWN